SSCLFFDLCQQYNEFICVHLRTPQGGIEKNSSAVAWFMLPLTGVRVLAVEQYGAGPFGTMFLADQGAEVIKIENPADGGDMSRAVRPHFFAPGDSQFFPTFNRT